jgi:hypothetical protein
VLVCISAVHINRYKAKVILVILFMTDRATMCCEYTFRKKLNKLYGNNIVVDLQMFLYFVGF